MGQDEYLDIFRGDASCGKLRNDVLISRPAVGRVEFPLRGVVPSRIDQDVVSVAFEMPGKNGRVDRRSHIPQVGENRLVPLDRSHVKGVEYPVFH
jgi:hypothetical protein